MCHFLDVKSRTTRALIGKSNVKSMYEYFSDRTGLASVNCCIVLLLVAYYYKCKHMNCCNLTSVI